jgi:ABC-type transporter Mla MlaB component
MLRISYSQTQAGQQWRLCGQLAGPWVEELRSVWERTSNTTAGSMAVVDLSDVTFIDESGERLLSEMRSAQVQFVAAGVDTKDLIKNLTSKGERPLRRVMGCFPKMLNCRGESRRTKV